MRRKKWHSKKQDGKESDWQRHQRLCSEAFEKLGYSVEQEDTTPRPGGGKVNKGKCDLRVFKDGKDFGFYECKSTTANIALPVYGKPQPKLKQEQMEFLRDMALAGCRAGLLVEYIKQDVRRVFFFEYDAIMHMVAAEISSCRGLMPSITLSRLIQYASEIQITADKYDFSKLVI